MTNQNIIKLNDLIVNNEDFRKKIADADSKINEKYGKDLTDEQKAAAFDEFISPIAADAGISISADEMKNFADNHSDELSEEELVGVAGGGWGWGFSLCWVGGIGIGATGTDDDKHGSGCCIIGIGDSTGICVSAGAVTGYCTVPGND